MTGKLYVCATPIGNLDDITFRVLETLKMVDCIAAEDTRHTLKLLNHFEIKKPLVSYHEHNRHKRGQELVQRLKEGQNIALVSDAGMPAISDPGYELVAVCHREAVPVTVLPGATAFACALVLSGMPSDRFHFEGFLPAQKKERQQRLAFLKSYPHTLILYESPHRLLSTLKELYEAVGEVKIACVRELTKKYEEVICKPLAEMIVHYEETSPKGEFVLILEEKNAPEKPVKDAVAVLSELPAEHHLAYYVQQGMDEKEALKQVAKDRNVPKREIYKIIHGGL